MAPAEKTAAHRRLRIHNVDDNLDQVHTMAYLLKDMGHHVDFAINGIAALDVAERGRPQVVLLDIGLPDTSGFHLVRQLRLDPELKDAFIVGITGMNIDRADALARGFNELLEKPVDARDLEKVLTRVP